MAKFTPGPWSISDDREWDGSDSLDILTSGGWGDGLPWIAGVHGANVGPKDKEETEANANLIAAAPEMYEALKTTAGNLRSLIAATNCRTYDVWLETAESALAKADGKAAADAQR